MKITRKQPLVSILIPVHNGNGFLPAALESTLNQTYKNIEVIAIDDGSTDNSYEILRNYAGIDSRLKVFRNRRNLNIANTLNRAVKYAHGKFIARMDADDIMSPERIQTQVEYLIKHPEVVVVGGQCLTIDINGNSLGHKLFPTTDKKIRESLFYTNPIQHPTIMVNRILLPENFVWYNPALPPAEDYDLFFRLGKYGQYANLNTFVLKYRLHLGSETFKNPLKTFSFTRKVRHFAISKYGYRPTAKASLLNLMQILIVTLLPGSLIYPVYSFARGLQSFKESLGHRTKADKMDLWLKTLPN